MPYADPERQRRAKRESARRRRSGAKNGSTPRKSVDPSPGLLDPADVLVRLVGELDRLDAAEGLDPAVRARTVARVCAVALAAHRQLGPESEDPEDRGEWTYDA